VNGLGPARGFSFPDDYATQWPVEHPLPASSIDELGHVTAAFYPVLFEDSAFAFLKAITGESAPDYVVARMLVDYRREVLLERSPVTVYVAVDAVTESSFDLTMVLVDAEGTPCTRAQVHYVAWDRQKRRRRDLEESEFQPLRRQLEGK
jgi:acyl-CoA thioesterase FadM